MLKIEKFDKNLLGYINRNTPTKAQTYRQYTRMATASILMKKNWITNQKENIKGSSVSGCLRWRSFIAKEKDIVEIVVQGDQARMKNNFMCKTHWACACCASSHNEKMRSWIRAAIFPILPSIRKSSSLITLTVSHKRLEDWGRVVDDLLNAFGIADKNLSRTYKKAGYLGKVRTLEATVGKNGLHPHIHILLVHDLDADMKALKNTVGCEWKKAVSKFGRVGNFDFKPHCVNTYVAKNDTSRAMTLSEKSTTDKNKGRTIWDLLDSAHGGNDEDGRQWIRAQMALGGRVRFHTGDLPSKLGIPKPSDWIDVERLEVVSIERAKLPPPVIISYSQQKHIIATNTKSGHTGLALILQAACSGGAEAVHDTVKSLCQVADKESIHVATPEPYWVPLSTNQKYDSNSSYLIAKGRQSHW